MEKMLKNRLKEFYHQRIIIDSSVLIKVFRNEKESDFVAEIIKMADKKETSILAPSLLHYEFSNVITRSNHKIEEVNESLKSFKKMGIGILPLDDSAISKAIKYCCEDPKISFYDAAYHAMAKDMNAIFLTADEKYYNSAKKRGNIKLLSKI